MTEKNREFEGASDEVVDLLLTVVVDELKDESAHSIEPYDVYLKRMRLQLYKDYETFLTRFKNGHQALIDELRGHHG